MSGLFGYLHTNRGIDAISVVNRMGHSMCHLPHIVVETHAVSPAFAAGRMHIGGAFNQCPQPVVSPDGEVCLWLCGELYHQENRRTALYRRGLLNDPLNDEQLALAIYLDEGIAGLTTLEGMFVVAISDNRRQELILINDRFGLYPHYYALTPTAFSFAPEIKGLLQAPEVSNAVDKTAIAEYIRFQQLLGDKTWLEDVRLLPPATILRYRPRDNHFSCKRYWDWHEIECLPDVSFDEAVDQAIRIFQRAIDGRASRTRCGGLFLSGGLDSRMILGFLDEQPDVKTFTFGTPFTRDVIYAAELARRAQREHHWFPFCDGSWVEEYAPLHLQLVEGMHSWLHLHGISTLPVVRRLVDQAMTGLAGGTVFPGNWMNRIVWTTENPAAPRRNTPRLAQRMFRAFCDRFTWPGLTSAEAKSLFFNDRRHPLYHRAYESFCQEFSQTDHYPIERRPYYFYVDQHDRRSALNMTVFMRSAVEMQLPFFDYQFVSHIFSLPERIRSSVSFHRAVLTGRSPELARVARDRDNVVPHAHDLVSTALGLPYRAKNKFNKTVRPVFPEYPILYADYEEYLRSDLRSWAEDILFAESTRSRGLFDPQAVRALWDRHLSGRELWTIGKIAPLIEIERVLRLLVDSEPSDLTGKAVPGILDASNT